MADNCEEINKLKVRVTNDQNYYERHGLLSIKVSQLKRFFNSISDNKITSLEVNLGSLSVQDTKSVEDVYMCLSEIIENH